MVLTTEERLWLVEHVFQEGDRYTDVVLTIEERVWLVEHVFQEGDRYTDVVQQLFAEKFPDKHVPHHNAVRNLVDKIQETGSVYDVKRCGRLAKLLEEQLLDISNNCCRVHQNHYKN